MKPRLLAFATEVFRSASSCAQLARYVQAIYNACGTDGRLGGSQVINEVNALTVSIVSA